MKFARPLPIAAGVCLVLIGVGFALALAPAVQRSVILRAVRDVPDLKLEVTRISAGFSGLSAQELTVVTRGVTYRVATLEAEFSLLGYLLRDDLHLTQLTARGVEIDASHLARGPARAAMAGAPVATPGILAQVELPFDLRLDGVSIAGKARLPGAESDEPLSADFTLAGGKIAPGEEGVLQLNATVRDPAAAATVTSLRVQLALRANLTPQRTFGKAALTMVVDADGPALSSESQLKVGAALFRSSIGENYDVTIDTRQHGVTENVLRLQAQLPTASRQYAGNWQLNARTAQAEPFSLGRPLPEFALQGSGKFGLAPAEKSFDLQGSLHGEVQHLEVLDPAWRAFGPIKLNADFDLAQENGILSVRNIRAAVAGDAPVLEARSTAPVAYNLRKLELVAAGDAGKDVLAVELLGLPVSWISPFVTDVDLAGGNITGRIDLARVAGSATAAVIRGQLQAAELSVAHRGATVLDRATVALRTEATLADSLVTAPVLEFSVQTAAGDALSVSGKLDAPLSPDAARSIAGSFSGSSARRFARWLPGAPVKAQGELTVALRGEQIELQPGRVQIQHAGKTLLNVMVLQAVSANLRTHVASLSEPRQPLARVELGRIPLALLPVSDPRLQWGGSVEKGSFEISVEEGKTLVRPLGPLRLVDVSLSRARRVQLRGLAIEALPRFEYGGPDSYRFQTGDLSVRAAGVPLLTSATELTSVPAQPVQVTSTLAVEVPALSTQPLFADAQAVSAGRATGEIRASLGAQQQIEARLTVNGLVAADSGRILPVANLAFRTIVKPDGAMSLQAPLLLDSGGRRSDLDFSLETLPAGGGYTVDGRITGKQVDLQDAQGLLAVFLAAVAPDDPEKPALAPPGTVVPDQTSAWSRFGGQVLLDVKSVTRGDEWAMTGLTGTVRIDPARLELEKLEAAFSETSRLAAKLVMRFEGGPMPYRFAGSYTLNDFDAGKLFKAFDPERTPTVEGLFNVTSQLAGNGETPARALERMHGDFQLTSRAGVFRGLQRTTAKTSIATKAVELGASVLGSLIGTEKAAKAAEKVAGQAYAVDQLAHTVSELKFDLLSVRLERDELLNMNLEDFSLMSEELRLSGRGGVTYESGKDLLDQPMAASLELAARGKTEELLGKLHLLSGEKDDLGYARAREPILIGGTLARPDPNAYFARVAAAKISELLDEAN